MTITIGNYPVIPTIFPDGTSQVWKLPDEILERSNVTVTWKFSSEAEVMHLAQLRAILQVYRVTAHLEIRYLPYARQDKGVSNASTFALTPFASLLNAMHWETVTACSRRGPRSSSTPASTASSLPKEKYPMNPESPMLMTDFYKIAHRAGRRARSLEAIRERVRAE
jgi:hypothetical protein